MHNVPDFLVSLVIPDQHSSRKKQIAACLVIAFTVAVGIEVSLVSQKLDSIRRLRSMGAVISFMPDEDRNLSQRFLSSVMQNLNYDPLPVEAISIVGKCIDENIVSEVLLHETTKDLSIIDCIIITDSIARIRNLKEVASFRCDKTPMSGYMHAVPLSVSNLSLIACKLQRGDLNCIHNFQLQRLWVSKNNLGDSDIEPLIRRGAQLVDIADTGISNQTLHTLAHTRSIDTICLSRNDVDGKSLAASGYSVQANKIYISSTCIDNESIECFVASVFDVSNSLIDEDGVAKLMQRPAVVRLDIDASQIPDTSIRFGENLSEICIRMPDYGCEFIISDRVRKLISSCEQSGISVRFI